MSAVAPRPAGFQPPPYPYDRLNELRRVADAIDGGVVDCSIGTPCDAPSPDVLRALAVSGTERSYPPSAGTPALRRAAADWLERRFSVQIEPADIAACVGTKELVASVAHHLHLRDPSRDTVLYPEISYPTYAMGATLAGLRSVGVPAGDGAGGGLDLRAIDPDDARRALLLWVNSPSNPTGALSDLDEAASWSHEHDVLVFSDECYAEFTWAGPPRSVLETGSEGVVAVHSLSKRSNLAGARVGFYAGDPDIVSYLRDVRQHAGLMVPGPVQAAGAVALADDASATAQRERYFQRLGFMGKVLADAGCPVALPEGGFYLWVPVPERFDGAWELTAYLAATAGLLVSPGDLYGEHGAGFVRLAVVQPMDRLELAAERLATSAP